MFEWQPRLFIDASLGIGVENEGERDHKSSLQNLQKRLQFSDKLQQGNLRRILVLPNLGIPVCVVNSGDGKGRAGTLDSFLSPINFISVDSITSWTS